MQYKETPIDTLGLEEPLHSGKEKKKGKGKRKMTEKDVWEKVVSFTVTSWNLFMSVNFIFSIVVMMVRFWCCTSNYEVAVEEWVGYSKECAIKNCTSE